MVAACGVGVVLKVEGALEGIGEAGGGSQVLVHFVETPCLLLLLPLVVEGGWGSHCGVGGGQGWGVCVERVLVCFFGFFLSFGFFCEKL